MSQLCDILSAYQVLVEQLAQQRPMLQNLSEDIFGTKSAPEPKSLIEISGHSNTGKSILLWQLMAWCLPPTYFGGKYCDIIFLDLNHKFCPPYFLQCVQAIINETDENYTEGECLEALQNCMDSMTIINSYSAEEFDLALDTVEDILLRNSNVALLAIDNIDFFYWSESFNKKQRMSTQYAQVLKKLQRVCDQHNICCVYTVNSHYTDIKPLSTTSNQMSPMVARYKFRIKVSDNGARTLNDRPIRIHNNGISFL